MRLSLPTDKELTHAETVTELAGMFGPSQGATDGWGGEAEMYSTAGWSFFLLKDEMTIETVSIFCMIARRKGESDWRVTGMEVSRGTARPSERSRMPNQRMENDKWNAR